MTRKRRQPERQQRKTKRRRRTLTGRTMRVLGALVMRHPSIAGGTASFLVIFGFVSANAVWYQGGAHPAPLFSTRDRLASMKKVAVAATKPAVAGLTIGQVIAGTGGGAAAASARQSPDARQTASIPAAAAGAQADGADALVLKIQKALAERQFYHGPLDGRDGVATRAAIEAFQAATSSRLTGAPSQDLLASIEATHRSAVAIPRSRPGDQPTAGDDEIASILAAPVPASKPASQVPAADSATGSAAPDLVAKIQTGLRNIAYSNVAVDGIAGAQTKAAIRNFEKNYRLPQTGEPNRRVLDKLKSIGAL